MIKTAIPRGILRRANQAAKGSMSEANKREPTKIATISRMNHRNHKPNPIKTALINVVVEILMDCGGNIGYKNYNIKTDSESVLRILKEVSQVHCGDDSWHRA